jgi:hypothetical protein
MSLETGIKAALLRVSTEVNAIRTERGSLAALPTTNKESIVAALIELNSALGSLIADSSTTGAENTWSINQIKANTAAQIDALVNGAGSAYDTLIELANEIQANDGSINAILSAQAKRVRVDAAQAFSGIEKQQARDNIDVFSKAEIGDINADFTAEFVNGLS